MIWGGVVMHTRKIKGCGAFKYQRIIFLSRWKNDIMMILIFKEVHVWKIKCLS
jgi:hypothetical protein